MIASRVWSWRQRILLPPTEGKKDYTVEFIKAFLALDGDPMKSAHTYQQKYGEKDVEVVDWVILMEEE